jgi:phenylacetate-CoA ligase
MFALPLREVIRVNSTIGPEGRPLLTGHTRNDLSQWGRLVARQLVASGVTANDIIQVCLGGRANRDATGYGLGAEAIEASVIAEDPTHMDYQLAMLKDYRPTVLVTTPLNALRLVREMEERKIDPQSLSLRTTLLSRPVEPETLAGLRDGLFADVKCNFGISEILDPGFALQCESGNFHANEDHFLLEELDGELVVTTLCREAMPLLRYRTRIACRLSREKCGCGRTGVVIRPGERLDGRVLVAESPLFESQIAQVLEQAGLKGHAFKSQVAGEYVEIHVPVTPELFGDAMRVLERLRLRIEFEFQSRLGIEARVRFTTPSRQ